MIKLKLKLLILLTCVDFIHVKTAAGGSFWNTEERCMSDLNNALCSASLFRVATETCLEQELSKMKITKALMHSNMLEEINQAHVELVDPALTQL